MKSPRDQALALMELQDKRAKRAYHSAAIIQEISI